MRDVVCVAETTAAAVVLGRVDAAGGNGLGSVPPVLPQSLRLGLPRPRMPPSRWEGGGGAGGFGDSGGEWQ